MLWLVWRRASRDFSLVLPEGWELREFPSPPLQLVVVRGGVRVGGQRLFVHGHRRQLLGWFLQAARRCGHRSRCARCGDRRLTSLLLRWPFRNRRIQWVLWIRCLRQECWGSLVIYGQEHIGVLTVGTNYSCLVFAVGLCWLLWTVPHSEVHHITFRWCVFSCLTAGWIWRCRWLLPYCTVQRTCGSG